MSIKVIATGEGKLRNLGIKELGRIAEEGEIFEIEKGRLPILMGENRHGAVLVKRYLTPKPKATKTTTKKASTTSKASTKKKTTKKTSKKVGAKDEKKR